MWLISSSRAVHALVHGGTQMGRAGDPDFSAGAEPSVGVARRVRSVPFGGRESETGPSPQDIGRSDAATVVRVAVVVSPAEFRVFWQQRPWHACPGAARLGATTADADQQR